ncbi:hypothetical protein [Acinetobacter rongchengensis]|uniref:Uncharacterized protein n=1 Tax=Acinetobacter rongchengensis TaxID=2419601 RepID=A0A3A8ETE6_9GAMM|nr:hypothetical protein [Acinetobacter rongchengensis]RKG37419.1 hypothetical protein D7V20_11015 [Acinetobacter rongchengensis]
MAESHLISVLTKKRAELLGQIESHQKDIQRISEILLHVDHTIKLFSPEFDLRSIKSKRTNQRNPYFGRGELQTLVLTCLREAQSPMNYKEIMVQILEVKGMDESLRDDVSPSLIKVLNRLRIKGIIVAIGNHRPYLWQIVD